MERTNFYDALYSPVVLVLNAVVVGIVMLLSASGDPTVLNFFGMSVGTSVAVHQLHFPHLRPIESLGMEIQTIPVGPWRALSGSMPSSASRSALPPPRSPAPRGGCGALPCDLGYGEKEVLQDLSMTVKQGEQITLIGRTGAGKSTVFKLLLGLYPPQRVR